MITPMQMYWMTRCDTIVTIGIILSVLTGVTMIYGLFSYITLKDDLYKIDTYNVILKFLYWAIPIFGISLLVSVFVPTTKEMAAIIVVPAIANNEKIQESAKNLIDLTNEWMVDLKPSKMKSDEK